MQRGLAREMLRNDPFFDLIVALLRPASLMTATGSLSSSSYAAGASRVWRSRR
jgi:hypothetical protein